MFQAIKKTKLQNKKKGLTCENLSICGVWFSLGCLSGVVCAACNVFVSVFAALSRRWLPSAVVRSRGWSWPVRRRRRCQRPAKGLHPEGCCSASTTRRELVAPPTQRVLHNSHIRSHHASLFRGGLASAYGSMFAAATRGDTGGTQTLGRGGRADAHGAADIGRG